MKSILVPTGGSATDQLVFETALAVAKPLGAHLVFLHIRMQAGQAAPHTPHVAFARGAALTNALDELTKQGETRATAAKENVLAFCRPRRSNCATSPARRPRLQHNGVWKKASLYNAWYSTPATAT